MSKKEYALAYYPSIALAQELEAHNFFAHVHVQPLVRTKDVELRLQRWRTAIGGRASITYKGVPIDAAPTQESVDNQWRALLALALETFAKFGE